MAVEGTAPLRLNPVVATPVKKDEQPATVPIPAEMPAELRAQRDANKVTAPLSNPVAATAFNALPNATPLNPTGEILTRGKSSDEIATMQAMLQAAGIRVDGQDVAVDRRFGPQTEAAVKQFQAQAGLTPDGKAGPNTKQALEANNLLVQAQQALATNTAEGAAQAKRLADQASAILEKLPPNEAQALRNQASGLKTQAETKAQELSKPTPEQLQQQEAQARTQKQNAAGQGIDAATAKAKTAADAGDQAAIRAEQAAARVATAATNADAAKAVDQVATALQEAKTAQTQAEAALAEAKAAQAQAPDPAALQPKVAEAQAQVDRAKAAVAKAQTAVNQAGQAVNARVEAERKAQTAAGDQTKTESGAATLGNDMLRHNEMAFNGALSNANSGLNAAAANQTNPEGGLAYLKDAKAALDQTRQNVEGIEAAAARAEAEAAKAPNPAALAPQVAEAKAAAQAARAKLTEMEGKYQAAEKQAQQLLTNMAGKSAQAAGVAGQNATNAAKAGTDAATQAKSATTVAQAEALQGTAEQALATAEAQKAQAEAKVRQVSELIRQAPKGSSPELQAKLQQAQSGLDQANQAVTTAKQAVGETKAKTAELKARDAQAALATQRQAEADQAAKDAQARVYGEALQAANSSSKGALDSVNAANRQVDSALLKANDPNATPEQRQAAVAEAKRLMTSAQESLTRADGVMADANTKIGPNDSMATTARENLLEAHDTIGQAQAKLAQAEAALAAQPAAVTPAVTPTEQPPVGPTAEQATQALTDALKSAHGAAALHTTLNNNQDLGAITALANKPEMMAKLTPTQLRDAAVSLARVNHSQSDTQKQANELAAKFLAEAVRQDPNGGHLQAFETGARSTIPNNNGALEADASTVSNVMAHLSMNPNKPQLSAADQQVMDRTLRPTGSEDTLVMQAATQQLQLLLGSNPSPEALKAALDKFSDHGPTRRDLLASAVEKMSEAQLQGLSSQALQSMAEAVKDQGWFLFSNDTTAGQAARARIEAVLARRAA